MHSYYSQKGILIRGFQDNIAPLKVSYFQKWTYFAGYKAPARINELVHEGILCNIGEEIGDRGQHYSLYTLTEKWANYEVQKPNIMERIKRFFKI